MATDVILNNARGYWDFDWTPSGDLPTASALDTYIALCLFEEQRASESEVPDANLRRGWQGNDGFEQGSKVWLFSQERATGSMLAELGVVVRNCLQPLIDDKLAEDVTVATPRLHAGGAVSVVVTLWRSGSIISQKSYTLWDNTGRT